MNDISTLKKIKLPVNLSDKALRAIYGSCTQFMTMADVIQLYLNKVPTLVYTDQTLQGNGSQTNPLKLAKQNASVGQALVWNGISWAPSTVNAVLTYVPPFLTLNSTPSVNISSFISSDTPNLLTVGTDAEFKVQIYKNSTLDGDGTQASPIKLAQQGASPGNVLKWNGTTWFPDSVAFTAALNDLTDVTITNPSANQALVYNGSAWQNSAVSTIPANANSGDILIFNGASWVSASPKKNTQIMSAGNQITLPFLPLINTPIDVFLNGILKEETVDYTVSSNVITFSFSFQSNDKITTKYYT
jgi:hypothetical protein